MKFKKIAALAQTATMVLSMTGCTLKIEKVSKKNFIKACVEAGYDEDELEEYEYDEDEYDGLTYELDIIDDDITLAYLEFDDADDAADYFDDWYDEFEDFDTKGSSKHVITKNYGYFVFDGEFDDEWDILNIEDDAYLGVYFADDVVIIASAASDSKKDKKVIDAFLDEIGYPKP